MSYKALSFAKKTFTNKRGSILHYRFLMRQDYHENICCPLVLFLHGAGERGADNEAQLRHGAREFATPENRQKYPCFVLVPQCPKGQQWADWTAAKSGAKLAEPLRLVVELIEQLKKQYSVDPWRLYVTGL